MFCPKCGNSLPDNAKFCSKCGYSFQEDGRSTEPEADAAPAEGASAARVEAAAPAAQAMLEPQPATQAQPADVSQPQAAAVQQAQPAAQAPATPQAQPASQTQAPGAYQPAAVQYQGDAAAYHAAAAARRGGGKGKVIGIIVGVVVVLAAVAAALFFTGVLKFGGSAAGGTNYVSDGYSIYYTARDEPMSVLTEYGGYLDYDQMDVEWELDSRGGVVKSTQVYFLDGEEVYRSGGVTNVLNDEGITMSSTSYELNGEVKEERDPYYKSVDVKDGLLRYLSTEQDSRNGTYTTEQTNEYYGNGSLKSISGTGTFSDSSTENFWSQEYLENGVPYSWKSGMTNDGEKDEDAYTFDITSDTPSRKSVSVNKNGDFLVNLVCDYDVEGNPATIYIEKDGDLIKFLDMTYKRFDNPYPNRTTSTNTQAWNLAVNALQRFDF